VLDPGADEVRRLIEKGNSKSAVEAAKALHKRYNNPVSEALLVEAYAARTASLREHHMTAEADALVRMVRERYPSASSKLATAMPVSVLREVSLENLVRPLNDPALDREERARIEEALSKRLDDPSALANCTALSAGHPLRTCAADLERALHAVTRGPVLKDQVALPAVSRRSPLAPWKSLVRAIASFYEHDDDSCQRYLDAIDPASPPARVVPALRALLKGCPDATLKPAARRLFSQVGGGVETLRGALESLDRAFASDRKGIIISEIGNAVRACSQAAPDLLERLKQHISIQAIQADLDEARVNGAIGGSCLKNAYFWLLFARSVEGPQGEGSVEACSLWEQFRVHAVHEGWFPAKGPEVAGLYLHMASLLEMIPPEEGEDARQEFRSFPGYAAYYDDQPREIRRALGFHNPADKYYLDPERLYEKACALDPRPEAFMGWMMWAHGDGTEDKNWKKSDRVAEAWRRALPSDPRPLLTLMRTAESRNAYQKALGFVEEAERLDPLDPEVRRARLKLLIGSAIRHLKTRKPRLAERELAVLDTLPQAEEGSRRVLISVLRWACSRMNRDDAWAAQHLADASALVGSEATACLLSGGMAFLCGLEPEEHQLPDKLPLGPQELLATVIARACAIGADVGIHFSIPDDFAEDVQRELEQQGGKLDVAQLRALAAAAAKRDQHELIYAVSAAGLARGGTGEARFLLIRAQAIPPWETKRRNDCIAAAAELARRNRDMELVREAVELRREAGSFLFDMLSGLAPDRESLGEHELNAILKRERAAKKFVKSAPPSLPPWLEEFDEDEDDDELDDEDAEFDDGQLDFFLEELAQAVQSGGKKKKKRYGRNSPF